MVHRRGKEGCVSGSAYSPGNWEKKSEERSQDIVCCRAGGETGELDLEERRER